MIKKSYGYLAYQHKSVMSFSDSCWWRCWWSR